MSDSCCATIISNNNNRTMGYDKQSTFEILINIGDDDEFRVQGFKKNTFLTCLYYLCGILSGGLSFLLGYWYPVKRFIYTHSSCSLDTATSVLIKQFNVKEFFVSDIKEMNWTTEDESAMKGGGFAKFEEGILSRKFRYFEHMFLRYYFNNETNQIVELSGYDNLSVAEIYQLSKNVNNVNDSKLKIYGSNYISVPTKSAFFIFFQMASNPFYVFQVFSFTLWYIDDYVIYPSVILFMTIISLSIGTYDTRKHVQKLHKMVGRDTTVNIINNGGPSGDVLSVCSKVLVPGDIVSIPPNGMDVPCDMVLLEGQCTVNESALTGESYPATKTPLDSIISDKKDITMESYSLSSHKNHTLYNGTQVLQASTSGNARATALVVATGFSTIKGRLIKSIIFPKPVKFKFFRDSIRFVFCLGILAAIGFIYTAVIFSIYGVPFSTIIVRALDIITIIISPALPTCMTVSLMYAVKRLKKHQIFCVDPARINMCGKIKMFVFDKTGTLTEDRLAVSGVVSSDEGVLDRYKSNIDMIDDTLMKGMASCHSLNVINGQLTGDPLDTYMFTFTKWRFLEQTDGDGDATCVVAPPKKPQNKLHLMKLYPFQSSLQRMSVIVKEEPSNFLVFTKGSPEMVLSMCTPESIPNDISAILDQYAKDGYRLLAISTKRLSGNFDSKNIRKIPRSEIECDLTFIGFIVFENTLKPQSMGIVKTLHDANIRVTMATGDNLYTAVAVARDVGIIKPYQKTVRILLKDGHVMSEGLQSPNQLMHSNNVEYHQWSPLGLGYTFVLTGETFINIRENHPELHRKVLVAGSVFARMSPDQKTVLINDLKEIGYGVGMCGDGANDCGALKAAHAGIALSTSEASVASPFTCTKFDISCVPILIREGRSTLVTSFSAFKYLALYCFIQFFGVLILYSIESNYGDYQFLYADLFLCFPLIFTMIQGESSERLKAKRPPGRLFHPLFLGNILIQITIQFIFQFSGFYYVKHMWWYKRPEYFQKLDEEYMSYENYTVIMISFYQYIWLSYVYYPGKPYNKPFFTNLKYMITVVITFILTVIINFHPGEFLRKTLDYPTIPAYTFQGSIFCIALLNFYFSYLVQMFFDTSSLCRVLSRKILQKSKPRNAYKHIIESMPEDEMVDGKIA